MDTEELALSTLYDEILNFKLLHIPSDTRFWMVRTKKGTSIMNLYQTIMLPLLGIHLLIKPVFQMQLLKHWENQLNLITQKSSVQRLLLTNAKVLFLILNLGIY